MNCSPNIITANFSGGKTSATTAALWQWDYGQVLCITGIEDLPAVFEVHFSTNRAGGVSTGAVGADGQVTIPNVLLTIGKNINAWIYLSEAQGEGETEYSILIPVKARPMPETYDAEVTGEFDDVVRQVSEYAETAQTAANSAGASATAAAGSASAAAASASSAAGSAGAAEQARADAVTAKGQAETAAQTATEKAQQTAQNASQAASDAGRAESAAERAESAETGAGAAKTAAEAAAQNAAASAATANEKATLAGQSATAAAGSASAAAQSAASIEGDVQIASQKASEAQTAAGQAVTAKEAAQTAQQGAETAATNAGQSASTATSKAAEAATSALGAAQSKTDAEAAAARAEQAAASLTVDSALSDTSTNPVQNKVITGELADVKSAINMVESCFPDEAYSFVRRDYSIVWQQGTINNSTGDEETSASRIRTDFILIESADDMIASLQEGSTQTYWARFYDAGKGYLGSGFWNENGAVLSLGTGYSASSRILNVASVLNVEPSAKYVRFVVRTNPNAVLTPEEAELEATIKRNVFTGVDLDNVYMRKQASGSYDANEIRFEYSIGGGKTTFGFLKLPPNYDPFGQPVPLIVFVHGSGDITGWTATTMTRNYQDYYNYLRDCGYAVFDCYGFGSDYPAGQNTWGIPLNNRCYLSGIHYCCNNYNIDIGNVFVGCKSLGGCQALSMLFNPEMPIKAVGMLAPELWWLRMTFGYNYTVRQIIAQELGFSEDTDGVLNFSNADDPVPDGFYPYVTANMDKWCGVFANFTGLPIADADKADYYSSYAAVIRTGDMSRTTIGRPLKIWIAQDDTNVSHSVADAVCKSIRNAGGYAQLRTMPSGTGGHHSVDNDANAPQTTNVITPLNITYASVPTAYYELEQFFRQFLGK